MNLRLRSRVRSTRHGLTLKRAEVENQFSGPIV
jgi:hypothetical protein